MGKSCAIFRHREIKVDKNLLLKLRDYIELLVIKEDITTFIFGSKSMFYEYCWVAINILKNKYPYLKRIVLDCQHEHSLKLEDIDSFENQIYYDEVLKSNRSINAGKYTYINRNYEMIDMSDVVLFYYNKEYVPKRNTRSGTSLAYQYAKQKNKRIYNLFNPLNPKYNQC